MLIRWNSSVFSSTCNSEIDFKAWRWRYTYRHASPCTSFNLSSAQEVTRMLHHPHQRKTCETHSDSTSDVSSCLAFKVVMCRCRQAVWNSNGKSTFKGRKIQKPHVYSIQDDIRAEQRIQVAERTVKKEGLALGTFGV